MTLDELREREQQARARLGCGCENPDEWTIEDEADQVEARHVVDGIDLVLALDGISLSIQPPAYCDGETLRGFVPAEVLVKALAELRLAVGPTAFDAIYGTEDAG